MWRRFNPNPRGSNVGDCTVRAISKALNQSWERTYAGLSAYGYYMGDMPSANTVWGAYLKRKGFCRRLVESDADVYTVRDFCEMHPRGIYILAIQGHAVCVINGDYYDSWDSGNEKPIYYWQKCEAK